MLGVLLDYNFGFTDMKKNHCGHMVDPSWTRCGECGALVQIQEENIEAINELKKLANEFLEDRVMEDWEYDFLVQETKRLGLSNQTLDEMINSYKPLQQANVGMSFDVGAISGFVSNQPCQLPITIENVSNQPFRKIQFFYRILQETNASSHQLTTLPQNSKKNTALSFTPKEPGQ